MFQIFEQIRDSANRMAKTEACAEWTFACGRIIAATRKVEELLSGPGNTTAIFDPAHADNDSELLTHPTAWSILKDSSKYCFAFSKSPVLTQ